MRERWPALMTKADAVDYRGISERKFEELAAGGRVRPLKIDSPHMMRFRRTELDAFIESLPYSDSSEDVKARSERLNGKRKVRSQP